MDTTPIDKFLARLRAASDAKSKEIRLDIAEANALGATIGQLLLKLNDVETKKIEPKVSEIPTIIQMDGGRF